MMQPENLTMRKSDNRRSRLTGAVGVVCYHGDVVHVDVRRCVEQHGSMDPGVVEEVKLCVLDKVTSRISVRVEEEILNTSNQIRSNSTYPCPFPCESYFVSLCYIYT